MQITNLKYFSLGNNKITGMLLTLPVKKRDAIKTYLRFIVSWIHPYTDMEEMSHIFENYVIY